MGERVNFGIIGAGGIARRKTIPGMLRSRHCRPVGVMDPAGADEIAATFNIPKAYASVSDLLSEPEVQAVYIASPVHCHLEQIRLAAEAGKHILCEKPLTLTSGQAREAVDACRKAKVLLQEGYMMKFHGAHQEMRRIINEGRLGRIVYLRAQLSCWYPKIQGAWRQDPRSGGGGALIDMASHLYDLLEFLAGPIRRVVAAVGRLVQDYRSEDASTSLLEFKSGAHGTVDCFFCIPDDASRTRLEVYGSKGAILSEGTIGQGERGKVEAYLSEVAAGYDAAQNKDVKHRFERIPFKQINPYTAECDYFARCILEGRPPEMNDGMNAIHILALVEKAYFSWKTKQVLPV